MRTEDKNNDPRPPPPTPPPSKYSTISIPQVGLKAKTGELQVAYWWYEVCWETKAQGNIT